MSRVGGGPMLQRRLAATIGVLIVCASFLYLFPYSRSLNNPNERTRVLQTRALVERGQLHIGTAERSEAGQLTFVDVDERRHRGLFVNDMALVCVGPDQEPPDCEGRLYPAKAPGTSLLGVPTYWLALTLGWVEADPAAEAKATWVMRMGGVIFPLLIFMGAWWFLLRRLGLDGAVGGAGLIAAMLGTTVYGYGLMFVGHATSGAFLLGGIASVVLGTERRGARTWLLAAAGGALTAYAVMLEYHAVVAVFTISVWVLAQRRWPVTLGYGLGSGLVAVAFMALHSAMFGHPLRTGHAFLASEHNRVGQGSGFFGIDGLHPGSLLDHLVSPYMGLIPFMPWLALGGFLGCALFFTKRVQTPTRFEVALGSIPLIYLLFVSTLGNWRVMNGWSVGPRYLTPSLLALSLCAVAAWSHHRRRTMGAVLAGLAAASVFIVMTTAAATVSPPDRIFNTFAEVTVPTLDAGYAVRNLGLGLGWGTASLYIFFALVIAATLSVLWFGTHGARHRGRAILIALLVAVAWTASLGVLKPHTRTPGQNLEAVEGLHPDGSGELF